LEKPSYLAQGFPPQSNISENIRKKSEFSPQIGHGHGHEQEHEHEHEYMNMNMNT
jgi:hypothetical protein